ncbi:MAG: hypothetical protein ABI885_14180, partial [Gammaproteobacteria bacterium]
LSQRRIAGDTPRLRGPTPIRKVATYGAVGREGAESSVASRASVPSAINDSQSRTTEYDGPLASSLIRGMT